MKSRTLTVNGLRVHYLFGGSERNQAVVILHGWAGDSSALQQLGRLLSEKKHFVVIPDLPGFGKSDKVSSATFGEFAALLNTFLDTIGVSKASLVGHSMGGGVAIEMAYKFPGKVDKLVLVDAVGQKVARSVIGWIVAGVRNVSRDFAEKPTVAENAAMGLDCLKRPVWLLRTFRMIKNCDLTWKLRQIKAQTFVVWGEQDAFFPTCAPMCSALGVEPTIIRDAGHDWIILDPEMANRVIGKLI